MEQSPSLTANISSASQEILRMLRNPEFPYCVHNTPQFFPVLSHINPFAILATDLLFSHLHLGLPNGLFSSGYPTKTLSSPHSAR